MECKRMSRKEQKNARQRASKIIEKVRWDEKIRSQYIFDFRLVGSGAYGTMMKDINNHFDLDYQILLTRNSKCFNKVKQEFLDPTRIKNDFHDTFVKYKTNDEKAENSTTAITLIDEKNNNFHIDFVIIDNTGSRNQIIRRNNKKETPTENEFTWNELADRSEAFDYFKAMSHDDKEELINEHVIPAKFKEKQKKEGDPTKVSSCDIFVREILRWKNEH